MTEKILKGQCQCGNIRFQADFLPKTLTECTCSICHRLGVRWAYYQVQDVQISERSTPSVVFQWNQKWLNFHHCPQCGCTTHYSLAGKRHQPEARIALNTRMCATELVDKIKIRIFDGAETWKYLN